MILAAILAGFVVYVKGIIKVGDFGLGGLFGYVVGIFVAQFLVSNLLDTMVARYIFIGLFCVLGGSWVMVHPTDKWLIISSLVVGAFSLVYGDFVINQGLDYFIFKSNFSNIGRVALDGGTFGGFDTNTIIAFLAFFGIIGVGMYLQKGKIV